MQTYDSSIHDETLGKIKIIHFPMIIEKVSKKNSDLKPQEVFEVAEFITNTISGTTKKNSHEIVKRKFSEKDIERSKVYIKMPQAPLFSLKTKDKWIETYDESFARSILFPAKNEIKESGEEWRLTSAIIPFFSTDEVVSGQIRYRGKGEVFLPRSLKIDRNFKGCVHVFINYFGEIKAEYEDLNDTLKHLKINGYETKNPLYGRYNFGKSSVPNDIFQGGFELADIELVGGRPSMDLYEELGSLKNRG